MKFLRYLLVTIILLVFSLILPTAEAVEITDINDQVVKKLQSDFKSSIAPDLKVLNEKKNWDCKLFGMRSRLQTTKKTQFYKFSQKLAKISNSGSQVIKEYLTTPTGLRGQTGPIIEEIRFTADKRLIGEMSLKVARNLSSKTREAKKVQSIAHNDLEVIAYSVCN